MREFGDQGWRIREFGDQGWSIRDFGDQEWSMREFGDQGAENERVPCAKGDIGTPLDFGICRELWTGRRISTSRQ